MAIILICQFIYFLISVIYIFFIFYERDRDCELCLHVLKDKINMHMLKIFVKEYDGGIKSLCPAMYNLSFTSNSKHLHRRRY